MTGFPRLFSFRHRAFLVIWYIVAMLACFVLTWRIGWRYSGIFGLLGVIYPLYLTVHAVTLRDELRLRGYEWVTFGKAFRLAVRNGHRVWRLPPRDETAGTPGYEDSVQGIEQFLLHAHDLPDVYARVPQLEKMYRETGRLPGPAPVTGLMKWSTSVVLFSALVIGLNGLVTLVCALTSWSLGWLYFLNFPVGWGFWLILAWALRGHLERLGYGVWPARDRVRLAFRCQLLCRRLPPARELEQALGTDGPIPCRALAHALMTLGWLEGASGKTIR